MQRTDIGTELGKPARTRLLAGRGHPRTFVMFICLISALAFTQSASAGPLTAQRVGLGPTAMGDVVHYRGVRYAAGLSYYRIEGEATVPAFSLALAPNTDGSRFYAAFADGNGIRNMAPIAYLIDSWRHQPAGVQMSDRSAAAYQVAIWSEAVALPVIKSTVPARAIRRAALRLLREAESGDASEMQACRSSNCGEDPAAPEMVTSVGDSTVSDQIINVGLSVGDPELSFDQDQALDLRSNGIYATVCTGEDSSIDTTGISKVPIAPCAQGFGNHPAEHYRVHVLRDYQKNANGTINRAYTGTAKVYIPRQDHSQLIQVRWNITLNPADVYMPASTGSPIITAQGGPIHIDSNVTLNPADLSGLGELLQGTVVARIARWGFWGLVALVVLIAIVLSFKDIAAAATTATWKRRRAATVVLGLASLVSVAEAATRGNLYWGAAAVVLALVAVARWRRWLGEERSAGNAPQPVARPADPGT